MGGRVLEFFGEGGGVSEKISVDFSSESSLKSKKDKNKNVVCCSCDWCFKG